MCIQLYDIKYSYLIQIIYGFKWLSSFNINCLHSVLWFQVVNNNSFEKQGNPKWMNLFEVKSTLQRFGFNEPSSGFKMVKQVLI